MLTEPDVNPGDHYGMSLTFSSTSIHRPLSLPLSGALREQESMAVKMKICARRSMTCASCQDIDICLPTLWRHFI
jgi:hypothetical protein